MRKYTVKELERIINLSGTAIRDQISKGKLKSECKNINKRSVLLVCLSEDDYDNLVKIYGFHYN